ncbi:nucleolar protein [Malassezia japonica]|uniref:Nucleolar protein n=1 Tax=Malassezia japonica TaxID=223818 RepID=A0AAF0JFG1_9BASI|nr:nucleolar protein [Malassezia japonica]WFD38926.1 nucleolar protein [Malassezia japonica]
MVRDASMKRKATPAAATPPATATGKKVRVAAPVKKVVKAEKAPVADKPKAAKEAPAKAKEAPAKAKVAKAPATTKTPIKAPVKKVKEVVKAPKAVPATKSAKATQAAQPKATEATQPKAATAAPKLKSALAKGGAKPSKVLRIHEVPASTDADIAKKMRATAADEDEDEDETLEGFPDEDDEIDSEEEDEEDDALATRALPTSGEVMRLPSSRDDAVVRQRLEQAKRRHAQSAEKEDTGIVYVGRLPHGFFEDQLKAYFSQFGDIRRLRLSRNKKTGHSKHYGFVEFLSKEVAEIVVETMNNYLLDGHLLQMALIPNDQVDPNLWIGANRKFRKVPTDRVERVRRSRPRTEEERQRVNSKLLQRQTKRRAQLKSAGIDYDFPGYQA